MKRKNKRKGLKPMRRNFKLLVFKITMAVFLLSLFGTWGFAAPLNENSPRMIVTLEDEAVNEDAKGALENLGGRVLKELPLVNGLVVILPDNAAVTTARGLTGIKAVEKDARVFAIAPPGGCTPWPDCKNGGDSEPPPADGQTIEWGISRIGADLAWTISRGADENGIGVNVAVIDTGIDKTHPDLVDNIQGGENFVAKSFFKDPDPNKWSDDNGHGSHVAGTIAAVDNIIGVVGVAPDANLWGVKVLDRRGSGYTSNVIAGITWAIDNNMQVINMSLGSSSDTQALHDAVDAANAAGIVVVAAAGNSGDGDGTTNKVIYPAKYDSVIAVAATDENDNTPSWSSEGEEVELAAPGVGIYSTWKDGGYDTKNGTSMASPHVAGTVALMLGADPTLDPETVRLFLQGAADDLGEPGFDHFFGYGLVDAEESVTAPPAN